MDDSAPALGLDRQIDTLAREGALLAATVRRDPGGRLRSCPDWTSGDLSPTSPPSSATPTAS